MNIDYTKITKAEAIPEADSMIEMSFKMKWSFFYGLENMKARGFKP